VREQNKNVGNIIKNMCEHVGTLWVVINFWPELIPLPIGLLLNLIFGIFHIPIIRMVICPCPIRSLQVFSYPVMTAAQVLSDLGSQILLLDEKGDGWVKWKTLQLVDEKEDEWVKWTPSGS
jgi:hypothetical protein